MVNLLNWLFAYGQRLQVVQAQTDEVAAEITEELTINELLKKGWKDFVRLVMRIVQKLKNLDDRTIERLIWIGIIIGGICLYYFSRRNNKQTPSSRKNKQDKKPQNNGPKRNNSLRNMKQYKSQSESDSSSSKSSNEMKKKQNPKKIIKEQTKQCESEEKSEGYSAKYEQIQKKQDDFFFTLIGSYKKTMQKQIQEDETKSKISKQDFKCQYEFDEGELAHISNKYSQKIVDFFNVEIN